MFLVNESTILKRTNHFADFLALSRVSKWPECSIPSRSGILIFTFRPIRRSTNSVTMPNSSSFNDNTELRLLRPERGTMMMKTMRQTILNVIIIDKYKNSIKLILIGYEKFVERNLQSKCNSRALSVPMMNSWRTAFEISRHSNSCRHCEE